jgi:hypothetical protein
MTDLVQFVRNEIEETLLRNCTFACLPLEKLSEIADRIEKLEAVTKDNARWLAAYHKWCEMNGCAPSSSDLIAARKALEGKDG